MITKYKLDGGAVKDLRRLPKEVIERIIKKLDYFVASGTPLKFAKPLKDFSIGEYRFRVGDYRVVFDVEGDVVVVLAVGHRREIYK